MSVKVLGLTLSPFVRKVTALCAEKSIPHTVEPVTPFSPPDGWREISPLGKIPALDHDGKIVNDSSVICRYLESVFPDTPLYPKDPYQAARAEWIEEFVDGGLIPLFGPSVFMPLVLKPLLEGGEPDAATIEAAGRAVRDDLGPHLQYLEAQLGADGFFVGGRLSIADLSVASFFVNARHAGFPPDAARFPKLAAFVERMHTRPSFAKTIAEERPVAGKRWV